MSCYVPVKAGKGWPGNGPAHGECSPRDAELDVSNGMGRTIDEEKYIIISANARSNTSINAA